MGGQRRLDVRAPEDHGIQARLRPLLLLVGRKRACTCPRGRERLTTPHHLTKNQLQYNDECLRAPTLEIHAEPAPSAAPSCLLRRGLALRPSTAGASKPRVGYSVPFSSAGPRKK